MAVIPRRVRRAACSSQCLRGGLLAITATVLGVAAHAAAGGYVSHPGVLLPLAMLTAVAGSGNLLHPVQVLGVLARSQLAMYVLISYSALAALSPARWWDHGAPAIARVPAGARPCPDVDRPWQVALLTRACPHRGPPPRPC